MRLIKAFLRNQWETKNPICPSDSSDFTLLILSYLKEIIERIPLGSGMGHKQKFYSLEKFGIFGYITMSGEKKKEQVGVNTYHELITYREIQISFSELNSEMNSSVNSVN